MKRITLFLLVGLLAACSGGQPDPLYSGYEVTDFAAIIRDKETKAASLRIDERCKWELFAGPYADSIDYTAPIASGNRSGVYDLDVPALKHYYFYLKSEYGSGPIAERRLPIEGAYNCRDLGGFYAGEGRHVKWGMIFRSDGLEKLTSDDLFYLASIPLISVVDFRAPVEINQAPDKLPLSIKGHYLYSIVPQDFQTDLSKIDTSDVAGMMIASNINMVTNPESIDQFRKMFALLQSPQNVPLLYHCSAGKDRTGMATALVLFSLGVDYSQIANDYLSSRSYLTTKYFELVKQFPALAPMYDVRPEYLRAGIDRIEADHGSVENFLTGALGVDLDRMREIYLQ